ncbi:alpha/beta hydrolase family protein [Kocuria marina]|uniref:Predicted alpha/beta hydrolase n=1 Tax=Kocuria marina subsp. indica TaxID=1049583 RepID=A0A1X7DEJ7_9MICC|nr:alpha/beta hydrolase [Kocuria indica]OXS82722.1 esterase [Kocuria indica]RLP57566.1 esterase [Kocuria indica]SMF14086.1 Predicted alpha/beta hydrolase [Kocuria indica]
MSDHRNSPVAGIRRENLSIPVALDAVAGTLWLPEGEPRGVVVIHPATATPERFYAGFAEYVTGRGLAAVTYDYRGTGRSGEPRKNPHLRMRDWMGGDVPAVAAWTRARFPGLPLHAVGHSIGGHAMVLGHGLEGLDRFAVVSSHLAHTRTIAPRKEQLRVAAMLHVVGPALSRTLGYMPGKRLGIGENMPTAAMVEWGSWARRPGYFFDDPSMDATARAAAVTQDVLALGASDDPWASPAQMRALTGRLTSAAVEHRTFTPEQLGVARIGHHGLFRRSAADAVWPGLVDWLTAPSPQG